MQIRKSSILYETQCYLWSEMFRSSTAAIPRARPGLDPQFLKCATAHKIWIPWQTRTLRSWQCCMQANYLSTLISAKSREIIASYKNKSFCILDQIYAYYFSWSGQIHKVTICHKLMRQPVNIVELIIDDKAYLMSLMRCRWDHCSLVSALAFYTLSLSFELLAEKSSTVNANFMSTGPWLKRPKEQTT